MSMVLGTTFEMELRILLLLTVKDGQLLSQERMIYCDFMATYGKYFEVSKENLHGDNDYGFGELARRRKYVNAAIRNLVLRSLIEVKAQEDGFYYCISERGKGIADALESEYAIKYRQATRKVLEKYGELSDDEMYQVIDSSAKKMLRGGDGL